MVAYTLPEEYSKGDNAGTGILMFTEISELLTDHIDEITRRWVEALRQSQRTEVHKSMLTAEIVGTTKAMLYNLAGIVAARTPPDSETMPLFVISGLDSSRIIDPASQSAHQRGTRPLSGPLNAALQAAASMGRQRQTQGYQLHELVVEYINLRQIILDVLRAHATEKGLEVSVEITQYIDRLLDELQLSALENYYNASIRDLEKRAIRDPLTQLYNKDYFRQRLNEELRRAVRYSEPMTLAMLDMDSLKAINDTYGHPVGDTIINTVANVIMNSTRQPDVACRYGGDEFAVILPETDKEQARVMADRVLRNLQNTSAVVAQGGSTSGAGKQESAETSRGTATNLPLVVPVPTMSIGLAAYPDDARNPEILMAKADAALYQAKGLGKNCVFAVGDPLPAGHDEGTPQQLREEDNNT